MRDIGRQADVLEQPSHAIGRGSFGNAVHVQRLRDREPDGEARV